MNLLTRNRMQTGSTLSGSSHKHGLTLGFGALAIVLAVGALTGRGSDPETTQDPRAGRSAAPTSVASPEKTLQYVAFGDSWPEGAHCEGCASFAYRWADLIEDRTGYKVERTSFLGDAEESEAESKTSASLLASLSEDSTRKAVSAADVILIATGPNDLDKVVPKVLSGSCGGEDGFDCIRGAGADWASDFEEILAEIDRIRQGRPALVRLVNAANVFAMDPELKASVPEGFASTGGELMFELLTRAQCDAAKAHGAVCVDVRPLITGPAGDFDENSDVSMQAVADALIATGLRELRKETSD